MAASGRSKDLVANDSHVVALALQESSSKSLSRRELRNFFTHQFPTFSCAKGLSRAKLFTEIGFRQYNVFTINPKYEARLDKELSIVYEDLMLLRRRPAQHELPENNAYYSTSRAFLEVLRLCKDFQCTVGDIRRVLAQRQVLSFFPESDSQVVKLIHFKLCPPVMFMDMGDDTARLASEAHELEELRVRRKEKVMESLKNPNDFDALFAGQLKHGFDVSKEVGKTISLWVKPPTKPQVEETRPPSIVSHSLMLHLAFRNSECGLLTLSQINSFMKRHFYGIRSRKPVLKSKAWGLRQVWRCASVAHIVWETPDSDQGGPSARGNHSDHREVLVSDEELKGEEEKEETWEKEASGEEETVETPAEGVAKKRKSNCLISDVFRNDGFILDDTWTKESEDVYFKHEISIEEEAYPDESLYFESCSRKQICP